MTRTPAVAAAALAVMLLAPATPSAQEGIPDEFTNLQVLPKDIPKAELVETMKKFTRSLGVRCNHCHAVKEGVPEDQAAKLADFDFASDAKGHKKDARHMMRMVGQINATLQEMEEDARRVGCWTCHRGEEEPAPMPSPSPK